MSQANQSLKYNRGQLGKRKFGSASAIKGSESGNSPIEFDKIDPEDLAMIKEQIRLKARQEKRKLLLVYLLSALVTAAFIMAIFL